MGGFQPKRRDFPGETYVRAPRATTGFLYKSLLAVMIVVLTASTTVVGLRAYNLDTSLEPELSMIDTPTVDTSPLVWPSYGQAAIATRDYGVVATNGEEQPHPTASTAKVITMLAVLDKKPLAVGDQGPTLTLTQADVDIYTDYIANNGSNTAVYDGLQLTQYQAMQAVMLASSNNMADTLAVWAFGSVESYHDYANTMVREWGLEHTTIAGDASGLSPLTTSTASDLARIGLKALEQPVLAEIVAQSSADIPGAGTIRNSNQLLAYDAIIGVKTGETVEAGGNFILAGTQQNDGASHTIVVVVMGATLASAAMQASYELYQSALQNFAHKTIIEQSYVVGRVSVPWQSSTVNIVTSESFSGWVWSGRPPTITHMSPVSLVGTHTIRSGANQPAGSLVVQFGSGSDPTYTVPYTTVAPIDSPSFRWKLGQVLGV